jgi:ABC-2 type transport system permease protein
VSDFKMLTIQLRFINKAFWRNPASAFFTFAFPLMFLVIFTSLLGHGQIDLPGRVVDMSTYYVAAMASFAVISACYTNIAISLTVQRDTGVLKRTRGTPITSGVYIASRLIHALFIAVILVVITSAFGRLFYGASIPTGADLGRFLVMLAVGAISFTALGFAITSVIPNVDPSAALPVGYLHPDRQERTGVDPVDRPSLPGAPLRPWHASGLSRHDLPLE